MSLDDDDTKPDRPTYNWKPGRPVWADVNRWVKLADPRAYAAKCSAGCIGIKVSEGAHWSGTGAAQAVVSACRAEGLVVIGYQYGPANPEAFLKAFPPRPACIPVLDFEFSATDQATGAARIAAAERWIKTIGDAWSMLPWFYSRGDWQLVGAPKGTIVEVCHYWGPQYGAHLTPPRGVGRAVAWQYTDGSSAGPLGAPRTHAGIEMRASGETASCDMNALLVSPADLGVMARA